MASGDADWATEITGMSSAWQSHPAGTPEQTVKQLFTGLLDLISLMVLQDPHLEQRVSAYLDRALAAYRPAWGASARAVWATHLWHLGDEAADIEMYAAKREGRGRARLQVLT